MIYRSLVMMLCGVLMAVCYNAYCPCVGLVINRSISLPGTVFLSLPARHCRKGDTVTFEHPAFSKALAKRIEGMPGDKVSVKNRIFYINGVPRGKLLSHDTRGKPLKPIADQVIPPGYRAVLGTHPKSYDSRYDDVGLIALSRLQKKLVRLW